MMINATLRMTLLGTALLLVACGGNDDAAAAGTEPDAGTLLDSSRQSAEEAVAAAALPQPDAGKPLASYAELDSGQQVMFMYAAVSKLPPDLEKLAETYSREYRQTSDAFRKNDLFQAIKPQLEQGIAQAASDPYAWVDIRDADMESYDFERRGFTVREFNTDMHRYFNDASAYTYQWANRDQLAFAPVTDEAVARKLESMRTEWNNMPQLRVYFFAQSADLNSQRINALVTHVQMRDRNGTVLYEYGPGDAPDHQ